MPDDPHRDELAAARARIEALERANEDLRARLAPRLALEALPAQHPKGRRGKVARVLRFLPLATILVGAISGVVLIVRTLRTHASGHVVASGPSLGSWTMHVDDCTSGQRDGFLGVDLWDSADGRLGVRVIRDPVDGTVVNVNEPGSAKKALQFREGACRVLDAEVQRQGGSVNDVDNMLGHIVLDCTEGADHIAGDATFENCH